MDYLARVERDEVKEILPVLTAIFSIAVLEAIALLKGIDGGIFMTSIAAISGLGGYAFGKKRRER